MVDFFPTDRWIVCIRLSHELFLFFIQNIDVDQIVMEYQSTCTPQPSISKFPPITPIADNGKFARQDENLLPPELSSNCNHGFKVNVLFAFCIVLQSWSGNSLLCLIFGD